MILLLGRLRSCLGLLLQLQTFLLFPFFHLDDFHVQRIGQDRRHTRQKVEFCGNQREYRS